MEALNLTREQVEQIPAGRELDILIATRVLGWTMHPNGRPGGATTAHLEYANDFVPAEFGGDVGHNKPVPAYSTYVDAAWQVVEALNGTHYFELRQAWVSGGHWGGQLGFRVRFRGFQKVGWDIEWTEASTAPLAICRAALLAQLEAAALPKEGSPSHE